MGCLAKPGIDIGLERGSRVCNVCNPEVMWGTFIGDAYFESDRRDMAEALDEICSPKDDYGFASGGVYCFWNVRTRRPLYIGRAVDLSDRFRAHNGLKGKGGRSKRREIDAFFAAEQLLGYSILVRSVGSQSSTARSRHRFDRESTSVLSWVEEPNTIDTEIESEIAQAEGTAIRSYWLEHNGLPVWNEIHGAQTAWSQAMRRPDTSGRLFCFDVDSLLQSRRTISELARDPLSVEFELELHSARLWAVSKTMLGNVQLCDRDILEMLDRLPERGGGLYLDAIRESGYLLGGAWVSGALPAPFLQACREAWSAGRKMPPMELPPPPLRLADER